MITPNAASIIFHPCETPSHARRQLASQRHLRRLHSRHFLSLTGNAVSRIAAFVDNIRDRWHGREGRAEDFLHPARRVTDCLIFANIGFYVVQVLTRGRLLMWGMKNNAAISAGQWWRFITPAFLHTGLLHVAINCYSLKNLGPFTESLSNRKRYMAVYAAGALGCTTLSYLCSPFYSVGASGAIYGLLGAHAVFIARHQKQLGRGMARDAFREMTFILLLNVLAVRGQNVDHWGHIGGFVGGAAAAGLLGPCWRMSGGKYVDRPPLPVLSQASTSRLK